MILQETPEILVSPCVIRLSMELLVLEWSHDRWRQRGTALPSLPVFPKFALRHLLPPVQIEETNRNYGVFLYQYG